MKKVLTLILILSVALLYSQTKENIEEFKGEKPSVARNINTNIASSLESNEIRAINGCGSAGFYDIEAASPYDCNDTIWLSSWDTTAAGGFINPAFGFTIVTDIFSDTENSAYIYEDGVLFYNNNFLIPESTEWTLYGGYMNPNAIYTYEWCDSFGDGSFDWWVEDYTNNVQITSGTWTYSTAGECHSVDFGPLGGTYGFHQTVPSAGFTDLGNGSAYFVCSQAGPGSYSFYYEFSNGAGDCFGTSATQTITVVGPTASAGSDETICAGASVAIGGSPTATGGTPGYTYAWSPSTGLSSTTIANPVATPGSNTTYTVTITDADGGGCTSVSDVDVNVNPLPSVTVTANLPVCVGEDLILDETAGEATSWSWSGPNGFTSTDHSPTISGVTIADNGLYIVNVSDGNCNNSGNISVTISTLPSVNPTATSPVCEGSNIIFGEDGGDATTWSWSGPDGFVSPVQAPTITGSTLLADGSYTVTVSDGTCNNSASVSVVINDAPEVDAGSADAVCADAGTYTLSGSYGGGASSVLWTCTGDGTFSDATSPTAIYTISSNDTVAGSVVFTLTTDDPAGDCGEVDASMTLTITPLDDARFNYAMGTYCNTAADPTPTIVGITGGIFTASAGITINPSTGELDISSGTIGNTYTVTYTTSGSCPNSETFDVTISSGANAEFLYNSPICSSGANPLPNHSSGGTNGLYEDNNATGNLFFVSQGTGEIDLSATLPGTYEIKNTVDLGACGTDIQTFDITIDEAAEVFAGNDITVCESDGFYALSTATLGGSAVSIVWSGGAGIFGSNTDINTDYIFDASEVGPVTLTVTTNNPGTSCVAVSDDITITINDSAEVSAGIDAIICADGTYTLIGTQGGTTSNISWTTGGDGSFDDNTSLTAVYTPGATDKTNMLVVLTISSDNPAGPCGIVIDEMTLTINPLPAVIVGSNSPICDGEDINFTESGGDAISWVWDGPSNPDDIQNPTILSAAITATGLYSVTVTDGNICSSVASLSVTVNALPIVIAASNAPICDGFNLELTEIGGEADAWQWTSNTSYDPDNIQSPIHNNSLPAESGKYYVIGTNSVTTCSSMDSVSVIINALPNVYAGADQSIPSGTSTIISDATPAGMQYLWQPHTLLENADSLVLNPTTVALSSTTDFIIEVTDPATGCSNTDTMQINIIACELSLVQKIDVLCYSDYTGSVSIILENGIADYSFYIYSSGFEVESHIGSIDSSYTFSNLAEGDYQIVSIDGTGCEDAMSITIDSAPEMFVSSQVVGLTCFERNNGVISLEVSGGVPTYTYLWSGPNGFSSALDSIYLLHPGLYDVTVSDFNNCTVELSGLNVIEPGQPGVTLGVQNQEQCYGFATGVITSVGSGGTVPYSYSWTNGVWTKATNEIDSLSAGDYHLIITDANNCDISDTIVTLSEYAQIVLTDSIVYTGTRGSIYLTATGGTPAYDYVWTDTELEQLSTEFYVDNLISGMYMVTVSDFYGCAVSAFYEIDVPFLIPTIITPNADGYNDTWQIGGVESYDDIFIEIYNRWGNVVYTYSGSGFDYGDISKQFDGTYNGADLPIGAYVYILDLKNGKEAYNGIINIVRTK